MFRHVSKTIVSLLYLVSVAFIPLFMGAQANPATNPATGYRVPKWDIFAGYSFLSPNASVKSTDGSTTVDYDKVNLGGDIGGAFFFNRYVGAQAEFGFHEWGTQSSNGSNIGTEGNDDGEDNYNKFAVIELEDQRKAIKTKHRDALEEIRRKQALAAKEAEAKKAKQ